MATALSIPNSLYTDTQRSAKVAGLKYVSDEQPGIQRQKRGRGFSYIAPDGSRIQDKEERDRIAALAIPPSWSEVWICPHQNGHLQATGRDLKGRKQYRYHPDWRKLRSQVKYARLVPFAEALPELRNMTHSYLQESASSGKAPSRKAAISAIVQLLDDTLIRIGNTQYSKSNGSYGLTTLRDRHVDIDKNHIELHFVGKSGVEHEIELRDRALAQVVKKCQEIPGYELFQYIDSDGNRQTIDSGDINSFLQSAMGDSFTAKDFRTWGGTVTACDALHQATSDLTREHPDKSCIVSAVKSAAAKLGNRPATCRKYYVHPHVIDAYETGWLLDFFQSFQPEKSTSEHHFDECETKAFSVLTTYKSEE